MAIDRFIPDKGKHTRLKPRFALSRRQTFTGLISSAVFGMLHAVPATATIPLPRIKPEITNSSQYLSNKDAKLFRTAIRASRNSRWEAVANAQKKLSDQTARDVLVWLHAWKDRRVRFEELTYVTQHLSDWPRMTSIRAKAEERLLDDNPLGSGRRGAQKTIDWFQGREPVSGEGRAALARAYYKLGDKNLGDRWLKSAWRNSRLTRDKQRKLYKEFGKSLNAEDHAVRADHLIWLGSRHFSKVNGLMGLLSKPDRALMEARMRVSGNRSGMDAAIEAVPASLKNDIGLLFERARWRRRKKTKDYALPVYLSMTTPPKTNEGKRRLWVEKKIMAYWAIDKKRFAEAYKLVLNHGFTRGTEFAEAEFLAGWLALTKLNQPTQALDHFSTLKSGVSFPVSRSRASYWQGRASEATGDGNAQAYFLDAAQFTNTYYGLLAAERLNGQITRLNLPTETDPAFIEAAFESDRRVRAARLLGEIGDERYYTTFSFHLDDEVDSLQKLTLLSRMGRGYGFMRASMRAAKQAARFQSMLTESGYPIIDSINRLPDEFDIPFVFAIARQESEFATGAVSSARAYGMMQMISSTARSTARKHRITYNRNRLTHDMDYSAKLGAHHLHDLLKQFDGSYIMAAAAYNAGATRVYRWNRGFGDPRKGEIDPIDWVESIPFTETRNYVQRVMENMQVYQARLNNNQTENRMTPLLMNGAF